MSDIGLGLMQGEQFRQGLLQQQKLRDELQTYPDLLQSQLQNQQAVTGINQNTLQYAPQTSQANIGNTNAQANQYNSNAGLINTQAQMNQFKLNNPATMLSGIPGQMAGIQLLRQLDPSIFTSGDGTPVGSGASTTGQIMPPQNPNQGGMAALNGNGMQAPALFPPNAFMQPPGSNIAPMMQNVSPQGLNAGMPNANPNQNAVVNAAQGNGQMFGGNPVANQMLQSVLAPILKNQAQTQWYNARTSGFNQLPPDGKAQMIAQTNAFGYDPATAANYLTQGYSLQQLAEAKGYTDPANWPMGQPSPTSANRTQTTLRNGALAELNAVQPWLTSSLAPYSQRVGGYSPVQIGQAISGSDPEAQANFIAAKAITPDYNALRAKIMNGQFGIGMAEELQAQAMNNFKTFEGTVPPAVFARAQQIGEQKFNEMVSAANNSIYTAPTAKAAQTQAANANNANTSKYSDDDIAFTAKKYGMTPAQVKTKLGAQ